ncbi:TPPC5 protein, partial [Polioptila caerulea]|nr:TPPC5 protein [Polioptila caerulea]
KSAVLERALGRPRSELSLAAFALLFSELVQYCQRRVASVAELQARLARLGHHVGLRALDALVARERPGRRETKNDDDRTFYVIEREPVVNTFVSVPRENSSLNCAAFAAGLLEAVLGAAGFPARVSAHWHKGTTLMIKFDEAVIARDKSLEGR